MPAHPAAIEAILFASGDPMDKQQLSTFLGLTQEELQKELQVLTSQLKGRGIVLIETVTEVELRTAPELATIMKKFYEGNLVRDLGKASLEAFAIIAYQEGATRGEVDWIRGVNSSTSLRTLLMRGLIEGKEDPHDKRRVQYTLTTEAFAHLGLTRTEDLPHHTELVTEVRTLLKEEPVVPPL